MIVDTHRELYKNNLNVPFPERHFVTEQYFINWSKF